MSEESNSSGGGCGAEVLSLLFCMGLIYWGYSSCSSDSVENDAEEEIAATSEEHLSNEQKRDEEIYELKQKNRALEQRLMVIEKVHNDRLYQNRYVQKAPSITNTVVTQPKPKESININNNFTVHNDAAALFKEIETKTYLEVVKLLGPPVREEHWKPLILVRGGKDMPRGAYHTMIGRALKHKESTWKVRFLDTPEYVTEKIKVKFYNHDFALGTGNMKCFPIGYYESEGGWHRNELYWKSIANIAKKTLQGRVRDLQAVAVDDMMFSISSGVDGNASRYSQFLKFLDYELRDDYYGRHAKDDPDINKSNLLFPYDL